MLFSLGNGFVFSVDPVMLRIGHFDVYWYGFVYTLGFSVLWLWLWLARRQLNWTARQVSGACIIFIVAMMASGRLFEVVIYNGIGTASTSNRFQCFGRAEWPRTASWSEALLAQRLLLLGRKRPYYDYSMCFRSLPLLFLALGGSAISLKEE